MMENIICVTNRRLCTKPFLEQIKIVAAQHPRMIILREKDLLEDEYFLLAQKVNEICVENDVKLCLNSQIAVAKKLGITAIHLPLFMAKEIRHLDGISEIGISIHSVEETIDAQECGATYLIAGHIFNTDCKRGLAGRGLDFLTEVVKVSRIPVYAIGGINKANIEEVLKAGASGVCMMSSLMKYSNCKKDSIL